MREVAGAVATGGRGEEGGQKVEVVLKEGPETGGIGTDYANG